MLVFLMNNWAEVGKVKVEEIFTFYSEGICFILFSRPLFSFFQKNKVSLP